MPRMLSQISSQRSPFTTLWVILAFENLRHTVGHKDVVDVDQACAAELPVVAFDDADELGQKQRADNISTSPAHESTFIHKYLWLHVLLTV